MILFYFILNSCVFWFLTCDWQDQNQSEYKIDISGSECNRVHYDWLFRQNKEAKDQGAL